MPCFQAVPSPSILPIPRSSSEPKGDVYLLGWCVASQNPSDSNASPSATPAAPKRDFRSKLTIVDLAGSERQTKTDIATDAKRLKEAERISRVGGSLVLLLELRHLA